VEGKRGVACHSPKGNAIFKHEAQTQGFGGVGVSRDKAWQQACLYCAEPKSAWIILEECEIRRSSQRPAKKEKLPCSTTSRSKPAHVQKEAFVSVLFRNCFLSFVLPHLFFLSVLSFRFIHCL